MKGGSALEAVCAAVTSLENNPVFNAGVGSCLTEDGDVEMDAFIMDGDTLKIGKRYMLFYLNREQLCLRGTSLQNLSFIL